MKEGLNTFPTFSILNENEDDFLMYIRKNGIAEKFLLFTTKVSSLLYVENVINNNIQILLLKEFEDTLKNSTTGRKIVSWLVHQNKKDLCFNLLSIQEVYTILLNNKNGACDSLALNFEEKEFYLKLWLYANERRIKNEKGIIELVSSTSHDDPLMYEKYAWPLLLPNTDVNEKVNFMFDMLRLKTMVEGICAESEENAQKISAYFKQNNCQGFVGYAFQIIYPVLDYYTQITDLVVREGMRTNECTKGLYESICINNRKVESYKDIKTYPLYEKDGIFYILHWNYFLSQIYIGSFMRFRNEVLFDNSLKSKMGNIIEQQLLRKILEDSFSRKWCKVRFSQDPQNPDAMFQIGNCLYIIECKDCLLSESVCECSDYEIIRDSFIQDFIESNRKGKKGKPKGITQLSNYIEKYISNDYNDGELLNSRKERLSNIPYNPALKIYPIIVFTDYHHKINGLNHFLNIEFHKIVEKRSSLSDAKVRRRIQPVTTISIDCLFAYKHKFADGKRRLSAMINEYHRQINNSAHMLRKKEINCFIQSYKSFDRVYNSAIMLSHEEFEDDFRQMFGQ